MADLSALIQELTEDLTSELSVSDGEFSADLLFSKVKSAVREVESIRAYPASYTEEQIIRDMNKYYAKIRGIALYDYGTIGMEGNKSRSENSTSVTLVDRSALFSGIIALAKF